MRALTIAVLRTCISSRIDLLRFKQMSRILVNFVRYRHFSSKVRLLELEVLHAAQELDYRTSHQPG